MISLQGVTFRYDQAGEAFNFPDWTVEQGEHCLILGSSGSGKTTLLHILAGILKPQGGKVIVGKKNLADLKGAALDQYRGQHIGLVFQKPHLISTLSLQGNLSLAQYLAGLKQDKARVREVLETLAIFHRKDALVTTLSQGEAQRASIARAVLNKPLVILADEPTSSLDDENCHRVIQILQDQASRYQATLIIATHDQRVKDKIKKHLIVQNV
jgi:putative ABC transport system ATP-binding protein